MAFVDVELSTSEEQLAREALEKLVALIEEKGVVGWEPSDADLEVILLGVIAMMALNVATVASIVPPAIFRAFGTQLIKLAYNEGAAATVSTKWTIAPEAAVRTIPAGTTIEAGGLGFVVLADTEVPSEATSVTLNVAAVERGAEYNGIVGVAQQSNPIDWVLEVQLIGESSGGAEQESDEEYLDRLAAALKLQAPRPITAANFAEMALDVPSSIVPTGVVVGRATSIDGYNPGTHIFKGELTNGSATVKGVTSFAGVTPKSQLSGSGIPAGTTVVSVNEGAKTLVLSIEATKTETSEITSTGSYENSRTVTTFVTNRQGEALTSEAMTAIETWLRAFRELNFLAFVRGPSTTTVYVTTKIHVLPGYNAAAVEANVKAALENYLSPATWGNPTGQTTGANAWLNITQGYSLIRYNALIGVIEAVQGVQYVFAGSVGLKLGTDPAPAGTADLTLQGPAPLAHGTSESILVSSE